MADEVDCKSHNIKDKGPDQGLFSPDGIGNDARRDFKYISSDLANADQKADLQETEPLPDKKKK